MRAQNLRAILVTGDAGYVGSHACKALAAAGYRPIVFDNLSRGHELAVGWGPLVRGDLHDTALLAGTLQLHSVVAVMHFAAFANVGGAVTDPEAYYRNNVEGTLALLSAMRRARVNALVFSSTCAVYGIPKRCRSTSYPADAGQSLWRNQTRHRKGAGIGTAMPTVCAAYRCGTSMPPGRHRTGTPAKTMSPKRT